MNVTILSPDGKLGKLNKDYLVYIHLKHNQCMQLTHCDFDLLQETVS